MVAQSCPRIRIGRVEFSNRADGLVLGDGEGGGGIGVGGGGVYFLETYTEACEVAAVTRGVADSLAERRIAPSLCQEPPRRTRSEPEDAPGGSITGLPIG